MSPGGGVGELHALVTGAWGAVVIARRAGRDGQTGPDGDLDGVRLDATFLGGGAAAVAEAVARLDAERSPRWVWWSAREAVAPLVAARPQLRLRRCWDLAAVHRLLAGGHHDAPGHVWAHLHDLPDGDVPVARPDRAQGELDLLGTGDAPDGDTSDPRRLDGHLHPGWRPDTPDRARTWARLALVAAEQQGHRLVAAPGADRPTGDPRHAAYAESAAELVCVELEVDGLPVDRAAAESVVAAVAGRRPRDEADERVLRTERDAPVLATVPGAGAVDLRSPLQVRALLGRTGFDLPDTRSWRLEPLVDVHPLVGALLAWRRGERMVTTYGYRWLDEHLGPDGRLRGTWSGSDGGAGRMTAQAGLHSLPRELRVAVRAEPGHRLVRADLGQVEPRVLAAVSGDRALAAAAREDDLYATVAAQLSIPRPVAKVAFLAAMYGQTSGSAGEALRDMQRAYPVAMGHLERAAADGEAGRDVRTWGGRRVRMWPVETVPPDAGAAALTPYRAALASRGRFARNAVVQGSAAELFKAWTATVRARLAAGDASGPLGTVVMCLHDELVLHVRAEVADDVAAGLLVDLDATAARWTSSGVRFVADVAVLTCWADAKD